MRILRGICLYPEYEQRTDRLSVLAVIILAGIVFAAIVGNIYTYQIFTNSMKDLENQVETLQTQVLALRESVRSYNQTSIGNISLSELYETIKDSVVLIRGYVAESGVTQQVSEVSGSGFVYNFSGRMVVNTNFHVVEDAAGLTVSFRNGNSYPATLLGSDPYVDFAVLAVDAPAAEFQALPIVSSSLLDVGDLVIAVGNPYGLTGSMTTGIVSQLGRTITEPMAGGYPIANVIQISTPINPGNSGGPLLNSRGQVVGITTAVITESQGIGFAIPSDTILREIAWLVDGMEYVHPWVGVMGADMTYEIAQAMSVSVTYGWLVVSVIAGSPADGVLRGSTHTVEIYGQEIAIGGDIIIAIDGTKIVNGDGISSYLETHTSPGRVVDITVMRGNTQAVVPLTLGTRPPPS
jgi:S1-C subfamily serine protease